MRRGQARTDEGRRYRTISLTCFTRARDASYTSDTHSLSGLLIEWLWSTDPVFCPGFYRETAHGRSTGDRLRSVQRCLRHVIDTTRCGSRSIVVVCFRSQLQPLAAGGIISPAMPSPTIIPCSGVPTVGCTRVSGYFLPYVVLAIKIPSLQPMASPSLLPHSPTHSLLFQSALPNASSWRTLPYWLFFPR